MSASLAPVLPQISASESWVSQAQVLSLTGWKSRWFYAQLSASSIRSRETTRKLPNGRFEREFAVSSLPSDAQARYQAQQAQLAPAATPTLPLFGPQLVAATIAPGPRVHAPKVTLPEAEQKHRVLEPILAMRQEHTRRLYAAGLRLVDGRPVDSQNRMIEFQIEQAASRGEQLNERTIKRWLQAFDQEGIAGLAKHRRKDAGRSRFFDRPEHRDAAALIAYLYLGDGISPGLSVQACHDMLRVQREIVGLAEQDLPHYDTVRAFLGRITPALQTFARRGRKEFGERMLPYLSRAYQEHANSIWVSDTMIADVEVLNDCIPGAPMGAPIRLRLTAVIDFRSRFLVGYSWAWEGSSASIASALRQAIEQHGPCDLCYFDNGKDYRKIAKGAVPGYMLPGSVEAQDWADREMRSIEQTGVLARLGIRVTHCLAHHPQSKHVERFFRTLHLTFCKLWSTYTGGKPSERPDQTTALMAQHRRAVRQGDLTKSHHPLASEFMRSFAEWVPVYHAHRMGKSQGMNGRSPAEVFAQERNPQQRPAPSPEQLVTLFWDRKVCAVRECQIRLNKRDYAATDALGARILFDLNGRDAAVAFDPLDPNRVAVLDEGGHLLTLLEPKQLVRMAPDDPGTQAQIAAMQQQRGAMSREVRERHLSVVRAGKQIGVVHPLHLLGNGDATEPPPITPRKPALAETSAADGPKLNTEDIIARLQARRAKGGL